jgi:hypothetical protein
MKFNMLKAIAIVMSTTGLLVSAAQAADLPGFITQYSISPFTPNAFLWGAVVPNSPSISASGMFNLTTPACSIIEVAAPPVIAAGAPTPKPKSFYVYIMENGSVASANQPSQVIVNKFLKKETPALGNTNAKVTLEFVSQVPLPMEGGTPKCSMALSGNYLYLANALTPDAFRLDLKDLTYIKLDRGTWETARAAVSANEDGSVLVNYTLSASGSRQSAGNLYYNYDPTGKALTPWSYTGDGTTNYVMPNRMTGMSLAIPE